MQRLSILGVLASASIRAEFQYRANVITSIIGGLIYQLTGFVTVWIIVVRFNEIGGWSLGEITFLYGMRLASHGIFYACFSQMFEADRVLLTGEYDRFLVRPISPLLQLFTRRLRINSFGDLIGGALLLAVASARVDIDWSLLAVLFLISVVIGGALVEGAVQISLGSLSFRFLQAMSVRTTVNEIFNLYGNYPFSIFPRVLEYLLTFALPVAFVAFLPSTLILSREDSLHVAPWLAGVSPLVGVGLFSFPFAFGAGKAGITKARAIELLFMVVGTALDAASRVVAVYRPAVDGAITVIASTRGHSGSCWQFRDGIGFASDASRQVSRRIQFVPDTNAPG